jgi:ATP-dependent RNA helicase RhlE
MSFTSFGLSDRLLQAIAASAYTSPTPIQEQAIPIILQKSDLIGVAQTGTGKTAAFSIPMLQNLALSMPELQAPGKINHSARRPIRALILSPTRELARQIEETVTALSRFMRLRTFCVYGGVNIEMQIRQLRYNTDIVIATPGRLLDIANRKAIDLSNVEICTLDEADRMLDMGFINDVKKIVALLPQNRQTLLFSATMPAKVEAFAATIQRSPQMVSVGERRKPSENVTQHFYSVAQTHKFDLLVHALESEQMDSVLVFSRTKHGADRIMRRLERKGVSSAVLHSNRSQSQRERALADFKSGKVKALVATDVAARGIDVNGISHVINFDIPRDAEDYIHRIGRTGRAQALGEALNFVSRDEWDHLRKIERHVGKKFAAKPYPGFVPQKQEANDDIDERAENANGKAKHDRDEAHPGGGREFSSRHSCAGKNFSKSNNSYPSGGRKKERAAKQGFVPLSGSNKSSDFRKKRSSASQRGKRAHF